MKGTILDFLELAAEKAELAKELLQLAAKHDFEFTDQELSEAELDLVAGGATDEMSALDLQLTMDRQAQLMQTLSNMMKMIRSTQESLIQNIK